MAGVEAPSPPLVPARAHSLDEAAVSSLRGTAQPLQVPAAAPSDEAALRRRRAALEADLARLGEISNRFQIAQQALGALDEEAAKIDRGERDAWDEWARSAEGPPPSPLSAKREALAHEREHAAADLVAARNAEQGVEQRRHELVAELRGVTNGLFAIEVERMVAEAAGFEEKLREAERAFVAAAVEIDGRRDALYAARVAETNAKNEMRVVALTAAIDRVQAIKGFGEFLADPKERDCLAAEAKRRLGG